ncbi:uncharacterized protein LOC142349995 isoform X2 [Convolutriloba macropyga]|uniref:uncharacterized protein LOC142349995 isoform X2 n=1 Tax=Convolutriloba macropyga TaxID=536237 RepID=UPI003F522B19
MFNPRPVLSYNPALFQHYTCPAAQYEHRPPDICMAASCIGTVSACMCFDCFNQRRTNLRGNNSHLWSSRNAPPIHSCGDGFVNSEVVERFKQVLERVERDRYWGGFNYYHAPYSCPLSAQNSCQQYTSIRDFDNWRFQHQQQPRSEPIETPRQQCSVCCPCSEYRRIFSKKLDTEYRSSPEQPKVPPLLLDNRKTKEASEDESSKPSDERQQSSGGSSSARSDWSEKLSSRKGSPSSPVNFIDSKLNSYNNAQNFDFWRRCSNPNCTCRFGSAPENADYFEALQRPWNPWNRIVNERANDPINEDVVKCKDSEKFGPKSTISPHPFESLESEASKEGKEGSREQVSQQTSPRSPDSINSSSKSSGSRHSSTKQSSSKASLSDENSNKKSKPSRDRNESLRSSSKSSPKKTSEGTEVSSGSFGRSSNGTKTALARSNSNSDKLPKPMSDSLKSSQPSVVSRAQSPTKSSEARSLRSSRSAKTAPKSTSSSRSSASGVDPSKRSSEASKSTASRSVRSSHASPTAPRSSGTHMSRSRNSGRFVESFEDDEEAGARSSSQSSTRSSPLLTSQSPPAVSTRLRSTSSESKNRGSSNSRSSRQPDSVTSTSQRPSDANNKRSSSRKSSPAASSKKLSNSSKKIPSTIKSSIKSRSVVNSMKSPPSMTPPTSADSEIVVASSKFSKSSSPKIPSKKSSKKSLSLVKKTPSTVSSSKRNNFVERQQHLNLSDDRDDDGIADGKYREGNFYEKPIFPASDNVEEIGVAPQLSQGAVLSNLDSPSSGDLTDEDDDGDDRASHGRIDYSSDMNTFDKNPIVESAPDVYEMVSGIRNADEYDDDYSEYTFEADDTTTRKATTTKKRPIDGNPNHAASKSDTRSTKKVRFDNNIRTSTFANGVNADDDQESAIDHDDTLGIEPSPSNMQSMMSESINGLSSQLESADSEPHGYESVPDDTTLTGTFYSSFQMSIPQRTGSHGDVQDSRIDADDGYDEPGSRTMESGQGVTESQSRTFRYPTASTSSSNHMKRSNDSTTFGATGVQASQTESTPIFSSEDDNGGDSTYELNGIESPPQRPAIRELSTNGFEVNRQKMRAESTPNSAFDRSGLTGLSITSLGSSLSSTFGDEKSQTSSSNRSAAVMSPTSPPGQSTPSISTNGSELTVSPSASSEFSTNEGEDRLKGGSYSGSKSTNSNAMPNRTSKSTSSSWRRLFRRSSKPKRS